MSKAIFEFNLPEEQDEYDIMNQASRMQRVLWDLSEALQSWQKYGHQFKDANHAVDQIRAEFYIILNNYEVNIDL